MNGFVKDMNSMLAERGMAMPPQKVYISLPNAKEILEAGLEWYGNNIGAKMQWQPAYDQVADWLSDNDGKGLYLYGNCGQGKTVLARYVIPAILLYYCHKVVSCYDMVEANSKPDEVLRYNIISIDDVGVEDISVTYGNKRLVFDEIMDSVEKNGKLIIITSNLTGSELEEKYGSRVVDRIKACTKRIIFNNPKSFRS